MASFKNPSFQDRVGQAAEAKKKALEQLRQRPLPDEKMVAERKEADERRQAARALEGGSEKGSSSGLYWNSKAEVAAKAAAPETTEADRKAARDARIRGEEESQISSMTAQREMVARSEGLEPPTFGFEARRSIQLS